MVSIFSDTLEETIKVVMDEYSFVGYSFDCCLEYMF